MKPKDETKRREKYGKVQVWARVGLWDANKERTNVFGSFNEIAIICPDGSAVWIDYIGNEGVPCFASDPKSQRETVRRGRNYCKMLGYAAVYLGEL